MNFNVPQFIDIEDKIAFQLTAKQLGWFALGGVLLFVIWNIVDQVTFYIWFFVIGGLCVAFAFLRPQGISLAAFLGHGLAFFFRPKTLVWKREFDENRLKKREKSDEVKKVERKVVKRDDFRDLARILDSTKKF